MYRKENTVLRASLNPQLVHVIPNAVVASSFLPSFDAVWEMPIETGNVLFRFAYHRGLIAMPISYHRLC